jgi:hypothetical protein
VSTVWKGSTLGERPLAHDLGMPAGGDEKLLRGQRDGTGESLLFTAEVDRPRCCRS